MATQARTTIIQGPADEPSKCVVYRVSSEGKVTRVQEGEAGAHNAGGGGGGGGSAVSLQKLRSVPVAGLKAALAYLLPHGYPHTVSTSYGAYAGWTAAGMAFSSTNGVLSMQSLLYAIGVGAGSVPLAAALNWVIKDGLGQLGGVLYAALVNNRFDSDPKRWRFLSALAQDASTLLEVLTPLAPGAFLPLAAIANIGKNISWLSASATRAGIHQTLALRGNLADVTGKAGSQTIAASTAGTVLGVILSPLIGSDPHHIVIAFAVLSFCHICCIFIGLRSVALPTVNGQRLQIACNYLLQHATVDSPTSRSAPTLDTAQTSETAPLAMSTSASVYSTQQLLANTRVLTPAQVGTIESFSPIPWYLGLGVARRMRALAMRAMGADGMHARLTGDDAAPSSRRWFACSLAEVARAPPPLHRVVVGPKLSDVEHYPEFAAACNVHTSHYVVAIKRLRGKSWRSTVSAMSSIPDAEVQLLLTHDAAWRDVIIGYLHACYVSRILSGNSAAPSSGTWLAHDVEVVSRGAIFGNEYGDRCLQDLELAGWWVGQPLLERELTRRIQIQSAPTTPAEPAAIV